MHAQALDWFRRHAVAGEVSVLDIGGRDINGTVHVLYPDAEYVSLDIRPGPGVDIVADAASWRTERRFDVVVCAEVFEHTDVWREICATAYSVLNPGGAFIVTCAGPGRAPHSAIDGSPQVREEEHYGNVGPDELERELKSCGFVDVEVDYLPGACDTRAVAWKPKA